MDSYLLQVLTEALTQLTNVPVNRDMSEAQTHALKRVMRAIADAISAVID